MPKGVGTNSKVAEDPSSLRELDKEGKIILEPAEVIELRNLQLRNRSILEYLIKWKNLPVEYSTWKDKNFIQKHQGLLKR